MSKIIECVPNFSEGRDKKVIDAISEAVRATPGAVLLDVDPGQSTNRTVFTFVGDPDSIVLAALNAAKVAFNLIDMSKHSGEHPRMGALDVCPFIPIRNVSIEECVEVSKKFGSQLARELNIPVYLYGSAAEKSYRTTMPQIRAGEYEGLAAKLQEDRWSPDFGPSKFVPSWGATVTGVRKFLIAYNINLLSTKEQAHRIALNIREKGRGESEPGRLKAVQGIGWWLEERNIAQVSVNITDMDVTPMHTAYEEVKSDAEKLNIAVTGSELVGLVPLSAMLEAAEYYIKKENLMVLDEDQKVHLAINRLGLSTLTPFNPKERIIEYCLPSDSDKLLAMKTVTDFVLSVGDRSPAPGGGSVSALLAALGAGLGAMVSKLSYGKRQWEHLDLRMRKVIPVLHQAMVDIIPLIDADTEAFNDYMAALKLPKSSEAEMERRERAMQDGLKTAIGVPMSLAVRTNKLWDSLLDLAQCGNINCKSDLQVAVRCLETAVQGARHNIEINLEGIKDQEFRASTISLANKEAELAIVNRDKVLDVLEKRK